VLATLPSGWRNNPSAPQRASYELDGRAAEVSYGFGRDGLHAEVDGAAVGDMVLHGVRPDPGSVTAHGALAAGTPARDVPAHGAPAHGAGAGGLARMRVDLEIGGVRRVIQVTQAGRTSYVDSALGHSVVTEADRFPDPAALAQAGSLLAPMPGTVVRVEAAVGDLVEAGAVILAIEAMKMEHSIYAPARGVVTELPISVGAQVDSGSVLAVLEEEARD
jgi:biotin carboxyl carrier protein